MLSLDLSEVLSSFAHQYLAEKGYVFFAKTINTLYYLYKRREENIMRKRIYGGIAESSS